MGLEGLFSSKALKVLENQLQLGWKSLGLESSSSVRALEVLEIQLELGTLLEIESLKIQFVVLC